MEHMNVLIAENITAVRNFIRDILKDNFDYMTINVASDGNEAKSMINKESYDFIICSRELTGVNGEDLLFWLRNHPEHHAVPFLMTSVNIEKHVIQSMYHKGVNGYLIKPFEKMDVIRTINSITGVLERRRHKRYDISGYIDLNMLSNTVRGDIRNVSVSGILGMFKSTDTLPGILHEVALSIKLKDGEKIEGIRGDVVRLQASVLNSEKSDVEIALMFKELTSDIEKQVKELLGKQDNRLQWS